MAILLEKKILDERITVNYHRIYSFPAMRNCIGDQGIDLRFASYGNEDEFKIDNKTPIDIFTVQVIVNKQEYMLSEENFLGYLYTKAMLAPEFEGAARD